MGDTAEVVDDNLYFVDMDMDHARVGPFLFQVEQWLRDNDVKCTHHNTVCRETSKNILRFSFSEKEVALFFRMRWG